MMVSLIMTKRNESKVNEHKKNERTLLKRLNN